MEITLVTLCDMTVYMFHLISSAGEYFYIALQDPELL